MCDAKGLDLLRHKICIQAIEARVEETFKPLRLKNELCALVSHALNSFPSAFLKLTTSNPIMDMTMSSVRPDRVEVVTSL